MTLINHNAKLPSAIVLGGSANAVSVVRCLGRRGIQVHALNAPQEYVKYSRYCQFICPSRSEDYAKAWEDFLIGDESEYLRGSVLLACSDAALEILIKNRDFLSEKFVLDIMNKEAQSCMLNKLCTYEAARNAGVPVPQFWRIKSSETLGEIIREATFPVMAKPAFSNVERYGRKYFLANDETEMRAIFDQFPLEENDFILMEVIPGSDSQLCSYYTYIDEHDDAVFDFTKRVIRRWPPSEGNGCYHVTDYVDEVKELSLKLLRHVGLKGVANVEFKRDLRDGKLKLIECNARFTAANCLLANSEIDLPSFIYYSLLGIHFTLPSSVRFGKRLWYPWQDFKSFLQIRKQGEITFAMWVESIMHFQSFPYFAWDDPGVSLKMGFEYLVGLISRMGHLGRSSLDWKKA